MKSNNKSIDHSGSWENEKIVYNQYQGEIESKHSFTRNSECKTPRKIIQRVIWNSIVVHQRKFKRWLFQIKKSICLHRFVFANTQGDRIRKWRFMVILRISNALDFVSSKFFVLFRGFCFALFWWFALWCHMAYCQQSIDRAQTPRVPFISVLDTQKSVTSFRMRWSQLASRNWLIIFFWIAGFDPNSQNLTQCKNFRLSSRRQKWNSFEIAIPSKF